MQLCTVPRKVQEGLCLLQGKDHTLFALVDGNIKFHTRKYPSPRRFISVQEQMS